MNVPLLLLWLITSSIFGTLSVNLGGSENFSQTSKLPELICNVIESAKSEDSGLNAVAFVTTKNKLEYSIIDDVMQCMPMEISSTLINLRQHGRRKFLKAEMVIMLGDQVDENQLKNLVRMNQQFSLITTETKILIITSDITSASIQKVSKFFTNYGVLNFVFVQVNNEGILALRSEKFKGDLKTTKIKTYKTLNHQLFPDKLKNLNGYKYNIVMSTSSVNRTNRIIQRITRLFKAIGSVQNSGQNLTIQKRDGSWNQFAPYGNRKADFLVGTEFYKIRHTNSIPLYSRNTFCASIPKIKRFSTNKYKFLTEYDTASIICIVFAMLGIIIVWKLNDGKDGGGSIGQFVFMFYGQYLGQPQQFSRQNRTMLTLLIQITVFTTIVMSVYNQRMIGIKLANPHEELGVATSLKLLMQSRNSKMLIDIVLKPVLATLISNHEYFQNNDRVAMYNEEEFDYKAFDRTRMGIIGHCDFVRILTSENEYFYKLATDFHLSYTQISPGPLNPHTQKIQTYINYAFEGGLTEFWETQAKMRIFGKMYAKSESNVEEDFFEILPFEKLRVVFGMLGNSFLIAIVLFILEIFYHECLRRLSWDMVRRWTTSMVSKKCRQTKQNINWQNVGRVQRAWYFWKQRRNLRVRRLNVRAANT